jgi:hypothetical protein
VLQRGWTEICFFGANDIGGHLKLHFGGDNSEWWLVVFDGTKIVAKLPGNDAVLRLNGLNKISECYLPASRITILSTKPKTLRFDDGRRWGPKPN